MMIDPINNTVNNPITIKIEADVLLQLFIVITVGVVAEKPLGVC